MSLAADLNDLPAIAVAIAQRVEALGGLNVLTNDASVHQFASSADRRPRNLRSVLNVNLRAMVHATQLALPHIASSARAG
jgi:citronellol/citronellal dehydrogenase